MSFILYYYIPQLLNAGKVKTTNKRPYIGVNGAVEGLIIQSDKPLCYEEEGEIPPYEEDSKDADSLGGHPAEDFVLDSELTEALAGKADATHTHEINQVDGLQTALDGKSPTTHNHNGVYAASSHTHTIANITNLQSTLNGKASSSHTHSQSDISGLSSALSGKANSSHNHPASQITAGTFAGDVVAKSGGAVGTKMIRNIYAGTSDIGVGASLPTGDIYLVYE